MRLLRSTCAEGLSTLVRVNVVFGGELWTAAVIPPAFLLRLMLPSATKPGGREKAGVTHKFIDRSRLGVH